MSIERTWKLDGKEVPFQVIIKTARNYGYDEDSGIYSTSAAVPWLTRNGHKVDCEEREKE